MGARTMAPHHAVDCHRLPPDCAYRAILILSPNNTAMLMNGRPNRSWNIVARSEQCTVESLSPAWEP